MQLQQPFDARTVDVSQGGGGLPISDNMGHLVVITQSTPKPTKDNAGGYVELTLRVIEDRAPAHANGKEGAFRLNLFNSSQQAVEIAYKQLAQICHVTGVYQINATEQLHNIPFRVVVGPQKDQPQYTDVKLILDANGNPPGKAGQPAAAPQPAPQGAAAPPTGQWGGQPPQGGAQPAPNAWGGQPQPAPQNPPAGAWGGAPQGQQNPAPAPQWGGQPQQNPAPGPAPAPSGAWAPQQGTAAPQAQPGAPATGGWGGQPAAPQQPPQGQWAPQGGPPQGGPVPWGARS